VSAGVRQTGVRGATKTQREREDAGWSEETEEGGVEEVRLRGGWWWWTRRSLLACLRAYSAADDAATPSLPLSLSLRGLGSVFECAREPTFAASSGQPGRFHLHGRARYWLIVAGLKRTGGRDCQPPCSLLRAVWPSSETSAFGCHEEVLLQKQGAPGMYNSSCGELLC
jgi:hypothetical protein